MQVFVRGLEDIEVFEIEGTETINNIKNQLSQRKGIDCNEIVFNSNGFVLADDTCITSLSSFELDVTVPLLGGKVHGSLARAGKVRGQTPKVEKQDKKKKKTGRAKRRQQYNRRFANVVEGFGPRRGPNCNH